MISFFDLEILGNFSSKTGCIEICRQKNLYTRLPNVDEMSTLKEKYADYKMFLKRHSILKPTPNEENFGNKSTFVKLKNLDQNIRFIIDGHFDFEKRIWMDNKRTIRDDDWFQSKTYYLNYPVLNDRIAFSKGKINIHIPSKSFTWVAPSRWSFCLNSTWSSKDLTIIGRRTRLYMMWPTTI